MKRVIYSTLLVLGAGMLLAAGGPEGFVGHWTSDPGTPTMTRDLKVEGKVVVMTEHIPGRNGAAEQIMIRKYPADGSTVTNTEGYWAGSVATGKMEGSALTVDTTQANGTKWHDVWTLSEDGKHYIDEMSSTPAPGAKGRDGGPAKPSGPNKFSYTKE